MLTAQPFPEVNRRQSGTLRPSTLNPQASYISSPWPVASGQKATLGGRIPNSVSSSIPASSTIHMGVPPHPLHTPSIHPPYTLHTPSIHPPYTLHAPSIDRNDTR